MIKCPQCRFENSDTAKFCNECGCHLKEAIARLPAGQVGPSVTTPVREERRLATVIFADLVGYTGLAEKMTPEEVHQLLDKIFGRFEKIIKKHDGHIERLIGDALIAVFGVPKVREDDVLHAALAALKMREDIKKLSEEINLDLAFRVGINTGEVIWGRVADGRHTVLGDTVNVAQRLQVAAPPGSIFLSKSSRQQLRAGFRIRQMPTIKLEGKENFVQVYELINVTEAKLPRYTPFIGRTSEFKLLQEIFEETSLHKHPSFGIILGEAGIGKSRLIVEFKDFLYNLPQYIVCLHGRCMPHTELPYSPVVEIIREYFHLTELGLHETSERLRKEATKCLPADPLAHHFLGFFLGLRYQNSPLDYLDSASAAASAFATFKNLIEQISQDCAALVLIIEDLYWSDPGTMGFLHYLTEVEIDGPVMVLTTSRSYTNRIGRRDELFLDRLEKRIVEPIRTQGRTVPWRLIELNALKREVLDNFIKCYLGKRDIPGVLKDNIWSKTRGNPFFLEEVLKALAEEIHPLRQQIKIPESLGQILESKIDKLPLNEKAVLQCASVMGKTFWPGVVSRCLGRPVETELISLEERGFIIQKAQSIFKEESEYEFRHEVQSEMAYHLLLKKDCLKFHKNIIGFIDERKRLGEISEDLYLKLGAYHAEAAQDYPRALNFYELYGDFERQRYLLTEALEVYTKALEFLDKTESKDKATHRAVLMEKRGQTLGLLNKFYEAQEAYLRLKASAPNWTWSVQALLGLATLCQKQGDYAQAFRLAGEAAEIAWEKKDSKFVGLALNQVSSAMIGKGLYDGAIKMTAKIRTNLEQVITEGKLTLDQMREVKKGLALTYNNQGLVAWYQGNYTEAIKSYRTTIDLMKEIDNRVGLVTTVINIGNVCQDQGDYISAQKDYEEALKLAREIGDRRSSAFALINLGNLCHDQGDHNSALKYYQQSLELAKEISDPRTQAITLTHLGNLYHDQGNLALALKTHIASIRLKRAMSQDKAELVLSLINLGALYFEHGSSDEATKLLEEAENITQEVKAKLEMVSCLNALGRLSILLGLFGEGTKTNLFTKARQYARDGLKMAHYLGLKANTLEALTTMVLVDIQQASILRTQSGGGGDDDETNKQLEQFYRSAYEFLIKGESLLPHIHRKETRIQFLFAYARYYLEKLQSPRVREEESKRLISSAVDTSARALNMTQELGLKRLLPEALYLHFLALTLSGDKKRALSYLDQGRRMAEMMGLKPYLRMVSKSLTL